MKKLALTLSLLISGATLTAGEKVASPDGGIIVDFNLSPSGRPVYSVSFKGEEIVRPSGLGFLLKDATPMIDGFRVDSITRASVDDSPPIAISVSSSAMTSSEAAWEGNM